MFTLVAITMAYFMGGWPAAYTVGILGILETSLSFDNAVVNAKELENMDDVWKHRFLTWGMVIAVFGMRIIFPLLIVAVTVGMAPVGNPLVWINPLMDMLGFQHFASWNNVLDMALTKPNQYAMYLTDAHVLVAGFGGAFLMMVFLKYFIDEEKDVHWISFIEAPLTRVSNREGSSVALTLLALYATSKFLPSGEAIQILSAGALGIVTYTLVEVFKMHMEEKEEKRQSMMSGLSGAAIKGGLASFIYLETLDASFSFDGVIGAFALSDNILIIALGLGVGAMFVRSMTVMMVEKNTLAEFRFLEHGAFYAIGALACVMLLGTINEIPESFTGLVGAGLIITALISSIIWKKNQAVAVEV
jgi:hypothetical protein